MRHEAEVVIVGGGLAGLAAAAYLARAGRQVDLFDSGELGGRAATREHGGFLMNQGPHAVYNAGKGAEVLKELGVEYTGGSPGGKGSYLYSGGRLHTLPATLPSLLRTGALSWSGKWEAARLLSRLYSLKPEAFTGTTISQWLDREVRSPDVRAFTETLLRVSSYADAPERASFGAAVEQLLMANKAGVLYVDGGWQRLVSGLREAAERAGARIHTDARVKRLEASGEGQEVVLIDGSRTRANAVLLAVKPQVAAALAPESLSLAQVGERAIPVRAACLTLALRRLPNPEVTVALGTDTPLYLSVHSAFARLAPEGGALIHTAKYLGSEPPRDPAAVERELEGLLDAAQPGWRDQVVQRQLLPNMIVSNWLVTAADGGTAGRPNPRVRDLPNTWIAGDWVGPAGMLADAALFSARQAATEILSTSRVGVRSAV